MDPSVIVTIILALLATGGAGGAAKVFLERLRRGRMRRVLRESRRHRQPEQGGTVEVSLVDVFWDLGASDYALAFMQRQDLLCESAEEDEVNAAHNALAGLIDAHGSYSEFVSESRAAIEEIADTESSPGSRRRIHTLAVRRRRVLYETESEQASIAPTLSEKTPGPPSRKRLETDASRRRLPPPGEQSASNPDSGAVDLDDVDELDIGGLFKSAAEGRLTERLQSWWDQRELRALKSELDDEFRSLYALYAERASEDPTFFDDIYDVADRWEEESERLEKLAEAYSDDEDETALASSVLAELASGAAKRIARYVERQTAETIETIHAHARSGDDAMAGYLVYLNRHAFFAGREPRYQRHAERIQRMAQEMRENR